MTNSAARTIQRAWRRTHTRVGRLGTAFNEGVPLNQLRNVPLSRLYQILLRLARQQMRNNSYNMRSNGLYYTSVHPAVRMTRPMVIENIASLTNLRLSPRRQQAAQTITRYRRTQNTRRRLAFAASLRPYLNSNSIVRILSTR